ncbi:acyltransferase family protein [Segetibacter aerophilus]|uniref:acyltransferase family protein n=1 Tax=Segetibacter aerophilus TaxID=670293 RepID=UPI0014791434
MQESLKRVPFIDKAAGIAILLVVYGHIFFPETEKIPSHHISLEIIYKFHMEFFMTLSGYLAFLSTKKLEIIRASDYYLYLRKKLKKFLPAYIFFSITATLLDILFGDLTTRQLGEAAFSFFFRPTRGSAAFLWYLYVLTGFYSITPFLIRLENAILYLLLFFGFLMTSFTPSPLFCAELFCKYFFFFLAGGLLLLKQQLFLVTLKKSRKVLFIVTSIVIFINLFDYSIIPFQITSICIICCGIYLCNTKWPSKFESLIKVIGQNTFSIYLLNTTILNAIYYISKFFIKIKLDYFFISFSFILTVSISIFIRKIFNKYIPATIYNL